MYVPYPIYGYGYGFGFDNFNQGAYAPEPPAPPEPPTPTVIINQNFQTEPCTPSSAIIPTSPLTRARHRKGSAVRPSSPPPARRPAGGRSAHNFPDRPTRSHDPPGDRLLGRRRHPELRNLKSAPNHVSLSEVDRDFSRQLNADRNVPFALPAR